MPQLTKQFFKGSLFLQIVWGWGVFEVSLKQQEEVVWLGGG
jgi:hypothetical protein